MDVPLPPDRIFLRGHVRDMEIGAFQPERGRRQRVRVDATVEVAPPPPGREDDVDAVLSYDAILHAIDAEQAAGRVDLLETLAERLAARVLAHPGAARLELRLTKLDLGPHELGVEIARDHASVAAAWPTPPPVPRVLLLEAGAGPALPALLDRLQADPGGPPALLVASPAEPAPRAAHPLAQRRIDLLAVEQAAWQLAARDPRAVVIASRTEMDHVLRQRASALWAPSRMVLDAADPPADVTPAALARWLADLTGARPPEVAGQAA
jgi:dihydroneopterin aldolase